MDVHKIEMPNLGELPESYGSDISAWQRLFKEVRPQRVLELGTGSGIFLAQTLHLVPEARAITVNYPPGKQAPGNHVTTKVMRQQNLGKQFRGKPCEERIKIILGDSRTVPLKGEFDIVMIDANHDTDYVIADTKHILPHIHEGSVVLWHDFHPAKKENWIRSVRKALRILTQEKIIESVSWFEHSWTATARFHQGHFEAYRKEDENSLLL